MNEYTPDLKKCSKCKELFPRNADYFYRQCTRLDGLTSQCRGCRNEALKRSYAANPEPKKAYAKKWTKDNPDKRSIQHKRHYRKHSETIKARHRAYLSSHKEEQRKRIKAWNKAHPDKIREYQRRHYKRHPEAFLARNHKRRARLLAAPGSYTSKDIKRQYKVQRGRCWWDTEHSLEDGYHIDHLIPISRGGHNGPSNIVLTCPFCNLSKHNKLPDEWIGRLF